MRAGPGLDSVQTVPCHGETEFTGKEAHTEAAICYQICLSHLLT